LKLNLPGGIYEDNINHDIINPVDKVYWKGWHKYEGAHKVIEFTGKPTIYGRTLRIQAHILCVSSLDAFDQKATFKLSKIMETNTRKIFSL
jgi:hypothetical protein